VGVERRYGDERIADEATAHGTTGQPDLTAAVAGTPAHSVGNHAMSHLLQRYQSPPAADDGALHPATTAAIEAARGAGAPLPEAVALSAGQRQSLLAACPEWAHRVRSAALSLEFTAAVTGSDWSHAATVLNGFNDADVTTRVGGLSTTQRTEIYAASPGWAARILTAVSTADLPAAWDGDVKRADDWTRAAVHLNGFNDTDIDARATALSSTQRQSLLAACPEWAHRVRSAALSVELATALAASDWARAATLLNGFNDADIAGRLGQMDTNQRTEVYVAAPAWASRIFAAIATTDVAAAWSGDIRRADDWTRAAVHLNGFNDADIATRVAALSPAQRQSLLAACPEWAHRVRTPALSIEYDAAVAAGAWDRAAVLLNGFNDADIAARIGALTPDQQRQLAAAARRTMPGWEGRILNAAHAGAVPAGQIFGTTTVSAPAPVNGGPSTPYAYPIHITFAPDPAVANATEIAFIQVQHVADTTTGTPAVVLPGESARTTPGGSGVDRLFGRKHGYYGYDNSGSTSPIVTAGSSPVPLANAIMDDRPQAATPNTTWTFETSVVAKAGPDAALVYSVVHWGFTVDAARVVTPLPTTVVDQVSTEFRASVDAWNAQAGGPAGQRNAPDQQPLPRPR
jgi:hypothetical protein